MGKKTFLRVVLLMFVCFIGLSQLSADVYANGHDHPRRGDRRESRHRNKFYRHYRYYPRDYFFRKRIYFYPRKRYYYYYDVYPEKRYYYWGEKDTGGANPNYLSIINIVNMISQGIPDAVIIAEIQQTGSVYKLTAEVIAYLKQNGASDELIDYMMKTGR